MFFGNRMNRKKTLLFRLTILYAGIFSLSALLVFFFFYYKIHTVTMDGIDKELLEEIEKYYAVASEEGLDGVKAEIAEEAENEDPEEEFYRLLKQNGEVIAATDLTSWGEVDMHESLGTLKQGGIDHFFQTMTVPGTGFKARMISAVIGHDAVLQIGETLEEAEQYLQIFLKWFLVLFIIIMILSSVIGWFMAKQALLDMEDVTRTAMEISNGAYEKRVQVKDRFEEIRRLGGTFNKMLDRIHNLLKSMREVNDNIAHDLRSPLTRIRGIAEMSLRNERSNEEYKNAAVSTIEECDRLIEMVNTMLEITEIESGLSEPQIEKLDIVKLVQDACELFQPVANDRKVSLLTELPEKLIFSGDRKKLQRVISNLLDNAIKYTPAGGTVSMSAGDKDERIHLIFEDTGMGISEGDLPHIFERFYRCDRSRSRGGIGLGLSLVKVLTEAMNGTIRVTSSVNKGSRFAVTFPL